MPNLASVGPAVAGSCDGDHGHFAPVVTGVALVVAVAVKAPSRYRPHYRERCRGAPPLLGQRHPRAGSPTELSPPRKEPTNYLSGANTLSGTPLPGECGGGGALGMWQWWSL